MRPHLPLKLRAAILAAVIGFAPAGAYETLTVTGVEKTIVGGSSQYDEYIYNSINVSQGGKVDLSLSGSLGVWSNLTLDNGSFSTLKEWWVVIGGKLTMKNGSTFMQKGEVYVGGSFNLSGFSEYNTSGYTVLEVEGKASISSGSRFNLGNKSVLYSWSDVSVTDGSIFNQEGEVIILKSLYVSGSSEYHMSELNLDVDGKTVISSGSRFTMGESATFNTWGDISVSGGSLLDIAGEVVTEWDDDYKGKKAAAKLQVSDSGRAVLRSGANVEMNGLISVSGGGSVRLEQNSKLLTSAGVTIGSDGVLDIGGER